MGHFIHDAIIVTADVVGAEKSRAKAIQLNLLCTETLASECIGYASFLIVPDGFKEGRSDSDDSDGARERWKEWAFENPSSAGIWVHYRFGGDSYGFHIEDGHWRRFALQEKYAGRGMFFYLRRLCGFADCAVKASAETLQQELESINQCAIIVTSDYAGAERSRARAMELGLNCSDVVSATNSFASILILPKNFDAKKTSSATIVSPFEQWMTWARETPSLPSDWGCVICCSHEDACRVANYGRANLKSPDEDTRSLEDP